MNLLKDPRVQKVLRDVAIALLVSLLAILGYNGGIVQPAISAANPFTDAPLAPSRAGGNVKTSHISALSVTTDLSVGDALAVTGASTLTGATDVVGAFTAGTIASDATVVAGTFLRSTIGATQVLGAGGTLSPVSTFQPISSTSAIGIGAITMSSAGTLLCLLNVGSYTITITDTGTLKLSGDATLDAADTLLLVSDGTNWCEFAESSN